MRNLHLNRKYKKSGGVLIFILLIILLAFQIIPAAFARDQIGENNAIDSGTESFSQDETGLETEITEPEENRAPSINAPETLQLDIFDIQALNEQIISNEIVVGTQSELIDALGGDAEVIKIAPQDGDSIVLDKTLEIGKNRAVTLTADKPVRITGAKGKRILTTKANTEVSLTFINVALDGNGDSGGIENNGSLRLENAVIQNCNHPRGGSAIESNANLEIEGCSFFSNVAAPSNYADGGAIYVRGTASSRMSVNIGNSEFKGNSARYGGAIRIDGAEADVTNCNFSENTAAQGSGIYITGVDLNVNGCALTENTGSGGAIFVNVASVTVTDSSISNNYGRGIYGYTDQGGDVEITVNGNSVVDNNYSQTSYGGGIIGYTWGEGTVTINIEDNAAICNNEAVYGGGISGYPSSRVFVNVSGNAHIENNTAHEAGGGIWVDYLTDLTTYDSAFENNSARTGFLWYLDNPSDAKQSAAAVIHRKRIFNTAYTQPFTNAYNEYDVNYATANVSPLYAVTYIGNDNSGGLPPADKDSPHLAGETAEILLPGALIKSGYYFMGWNTEPDGTGTNYAYDGQSELFEPASFIIGEEDVVLYAQWEKLPEVIAEQLPSTTSSSGSGTGAILTPPQITADTPESVAEPDISVSAEIEELAQEPLDQSAVWEAVPDYPPVYGLVQLDDDTIELVDDNEIPIGAWTNNEQGWTYYADSGSAQPIPLDDGSVEIIEQDGTPVGLWSNNGNAEWTYEEYTPARAVSKWLPLLLSLIAVAGLLWYFLLITRRYVTREEFICMLAVAIRLEEETADIVPYNDVGGDAKYYHAVMNAKAAGLLAGFPDNEFKPEDTITREEISSILAETARYVKVPVPDGRIDLAAVFKDYNRISEPLVDDICLAVQLKIIRGRADGMFNPKGLSTKRQAESFIDNLLAVASPYLQI